MSMKTPKEFDVLKFSTGKLKKRLDQYQFAKAYSDYRMKAELEAMIEELEATKKIVWDKTERGEGLMQGLNEAVEIIKEKI